MRETEAQSGSAVCLLGPGRGAGLCCAQRYRASVQTHRRGRPAAPSTPSPARHTGRSPAHPWALCLLPHPSSSRHRLQRRAAAVPPAEPAGGISCHGFSPAQTSSDSRLCPTDPFPLFVCLLQSQWKLQHGESAGATLTTTTCAMTPRKRSGIVPRGQRSHRNPCPPRASPGDGREPSGASTGCRWLCRTSRPGTGE